MRLLLGDACTYVFSRVKEEDDEAPSIVVVIGGGSKPTIGITPPADGGRSPLFAEGGLGGDAVRGTCFIDDAV